MHAPTNLSLLLLVGVVDALAEPLLEEGERPQLAPRPPLPGGLPEVRRADGDPALPQHLGPRRPEQPQLPEVAKTQLVLLALRVVGSFRAVA